MEHTKNYFFSDISVMLGRSIKHITRSVDTIITTALMPVAIMLLFVYVLGGAIQSNNDSYINYQLPGILLITVSTGVTYTAYRLFNDKQHGIFDRFHSMPIAYSTPLWGHVFASLISNMISVTIVVLVALVLGFRSSAGVSSWLAVIGILVLFILALTWVAVIAGVAAKTSDGATAFSYPLIFLPFLSSAFVPTETMPKVLRIFAENQPVTSIINSIRALLEGQPVGNDIWGALAWCVGILIISYCFAVRLYRKSI
jgi:ABC-2 type transport system permease protein